MRSSTGIARERALLFRLLEDMVEPSRGLYNLFRVGSSVENWKNKVDGTSLKGVDQTLIDDFRTSVTSAPGPLTELGDLCTHFHWRRDNYPRDLVQRRNAIIGRLRGLLSHVCIDALEPDLIIMDEFQRFNELLHGDHDAAVLAQELFNYTDREGNAARTLLLSATPYRMLTLSSDSEEEGDHYQDFQETLAFLFGRERGRQVSEDLAREMTRFRSTLLSLADVYGVLLAGWWTATNDECVPDEAARLESEFVKHLDTGEQEAGMAVLDHLRTYRLNMQYPGGAIGRSVVQWINEPCLSG